MEIYYNLKKYLQNKISLNFDGMGLSILCAIKCLMFFHALSSILFSVARRRFAHFRPSFDLLFPSLGFLSLPDHLTIFGVPAMSIFNLINSFGNNMKGIV